MRRRPRLYFTRRRCHGVREWKTLDLRRRFSRWLNLPFHFPHRQRQMASYFGERALERNDDLKREAPRRVHYYAPTPLIGNLARCQKIVLCVGIGPAIPIFFIFVSESEFGGSIEWGLESNLISQAHWHGNWLNLWRTKIFLVWICSERFKNVNYFREVLFHVV